MCNAVEGVLATYMVRKVNQRTGVTKAAGTGKVGAAVGGGLW